MRYAIFNSTCKGTTKNANMQENCTKVHFQVQFSFIFAALCDRSFGGIVTNEMSYKAESEGTTGCLMLAYLLHYATVASGEL
jgi:hypothetical protein